MITLPSLPSPLPLILFCALGQTLTTMTNLDRGAIRSDRANNAGEKWSLHKLRAQYAINSEKPACRHLGRTDRTGVRRVFRPSDLQAPPISPAPLFLSSHLLFHRNLCEISDPPRFSSSPCNCCSSSVGREAVGNAIKVGSPSSLPLPAHFTDQSRFLLWA